MRPLATLHPLFWKYRYRLLAGVLFVALSNIFAIVPARYTRETINLLDDTLGTGKGMETGAGSDVFSRTLLLYLGLIIGSTLLRGIFMFFMRQGIIVVSRHMEYDLKNKIFRHYLIQDSSFFKTNQTGDLMARMSEDVSQVRMYMGPALMYSVNLLVLFIITLTVMCSIHLKLTLIILIPLPFLAIGIFRVSQSIHRKSMNAQKAVSEISSLSQSTFSGIRIIRSFDAGQLFSGMMNRLSTQSMEAQLSIYRTESLFSPLVGFLIGLSNLLVVFAGSYYHLRGEVSLGSIAEFVIYVNMLTWPVTSIGWVSSLVRKAAVSQSRINAFLDHHSKINSGSKSIPWQGELEFDSVSFRYPETGILALDGLSMRLPSGEVLGITGRTGSGKSTLIALLLRQYDPDSGCIRYGGIDIREFDLNAWREKLCVVFQDVFLFSDTLARNISRDQLSENRWTEIFRISGLSSTISELKDGKQTMVGERGLMLSGGQKQRVSIARAIQKPGDILLIDDGFSAIDPITEKLISDEISRLSYRQTIMISHRPTTLMHADLIYFLDEGRVAASGRHETLLQTSASYRQLAQLEEK